MILSLSPARTLPGDKLRKAGFIITLKTLKGVIIMKRLLVTINDHPYELLEQMAIRRGINVQMMLRTIIVPQWLQERGHIPRPEPLPELIAADFSRR